MKKLPYILAAAAFSLSGTFSLSAADSKVLSEAGLSLSGIETPAPETPKANQWMTLRKITVNEAQPDMENTLIGMIDHGFNIDTAVKELKAAGFKAEPFQDNSGGYMVMADVTGQNAADQAVGLARYYYVNEVKVSRKVHNQLFGLNNRSSYAVKMGTIKGGMNASPVDLRINKLNWTITGGMNHSPVDVKIDHEARTITGGANLSPVELQFAWSPEQVTVYGGANRSQVNYTVNWEKGLLEGYANNSPVKVEFVRSNGVAGPLTTITGYANHAPVELVYNGLNGHIGGGMNHAQVDVNLVNCELGDFLQYFFLFLK